MKIYDGPRSTVPSGVHDYAITRHRIFGWILILLAVPTLVVGIADLVWTITQYGEGCEPVIIIEYNVCMADHIYTYVASPLWGAVIIMICGTYGASTKMDRFYSSSSFFFCTVISTVMTSCIVGPAIVILNVLEMFQGNDYWVQIRFVSGVSVNDVTKLGMTVTLAILGGLVTLVSFIFLLIICCQKRPKQGYKYYCDEPKTIPSSPYDMGPAIGIPHPPPPVAMVRPAYDDYDDYYRGRTTRRSRHAERRRNRSWSPRRQRAPRPTRGYYDC